MTPIPVTILTGFLGAGKTTILNDILRDPAFAETAVLINEFGDVQVDHDLVAEFSDELVMTATGCLCCTASSDIKQSLFELWRQRKDRKIGPFRRVIVETTGLMDPVPIINSLLSPPAPGLVDTIVTNQFALARMITLFDVINGPDSLSGHDEAVRQIALGDVVVLTKTDILEPSDRDDALAKRQQQIAAINPGAPILERQTDVDGLKNLLLSAGTYDLRTKGEDANAWLALERLTPAHDHDHSGHDHPGHGHHDHDHEHHHHDHNRHGDDVRSDVITVDKPISPLQLQMFIDTLKLNAGTNLLRLKGLIALKNDPDRPVVVHGVQHLIHPIDQLESWPSDDRRTKIVLIGKNLDVAVFRQVLAG
ncbi:MAG: GTP-binding protein [Pseudomonadota bacterium]